MKTKETYTIRLERDVQDRILPKDFYDILVHRFLPVISLTYISSIIAISIQKGAFIHHMFTDRTPYLMALFIVLWVSGPAIIWIVLRGSIMFYHVADLWYRILAGLMIVTITMSFILFPEASMYGLRIYFVISIPAFLVVYFLLIKEILPPFATYPLNAMGFCALLFGAAINVFQ